MPLRLKSDRLIQSLISQPESGMGHQIPSVNLRDGTTWQSVVAIAGQLTSWKGQLEPPFTEANINELSMSDESAHGDPYRSSAA